MDEYWERFWVNMCNFEWWSIVDKIVDKWTRSCWSCLFKAMFGGWFVRNSKWSWFDIVVFAGKMVGGHRRCHLNTCHIICSLIVHVWYLIWSKPIFGESVEIILTPLCSPIFWFSKVWPSCVPGSHDAVGNERFPSHWTFGQVDPWWGRKDGPGLGNAGETLGASSQ